MNLPEPLSLEMLAFFEMTPDLVCIASRDGYFRSVNQSVVEKLGYLKQELYSKPIASFIHPEDKELTSRNRKTLLEGKALVNFENRYLTKAKQVLWLQWTSVYVPDKELVFAIAKDITEKKVKENQNEEKYLRFRNLANYFKTTIEEERKYLAIELHEELAQLAAVVKMDLEWIQQGGLKIADCSIDRIERALTACDLLITAIRRISFSISPKMLEDLGLTETIKWLAREFSLLKNISCNFETDFDCSILNTEVQMDFFRICQQALNCIMYHTDVTAARISLKLENDHLLLTIFNDGKSDDGDFRAYDNIKERAFSINADFMISTRSHLGTSLIVSLPKSEIYTSSLMIS